MSMEIQWTWGRELAEERFESFVKHRPHEWIVCGSVPNREAFDDLWTGLIYPIRYYLNLEENVTTRVDVVGDRKYLFAKYSPPPTRKNRLKKFFSRSSKSK